MLAIALAAPAALAGVILTPGVPDPTHPLFGLDAFARGRVAATDLTNALEIADAVVDISSRAQADIVALRDQILGAPDIASAVRAAYAGGQNVTIPAGSVRTNLSLARGATGLADGAIAVLEETGPPLTELEKLQIRQDAALVPAELARGAALMLYAILDARHYHAAAVVSVSPTDLDVVLYNGSALSTIHRRAVYEPVGGDERLVFSTLDQAVIDAAKRVAAAYDRPQAVRAVTALAEALDEMTGLDLSPLGPGPSRATGCTNSTLWFRTDDCRILIGDSTNHEYYAQYGGNTCSSQSDRHDRTIMLLDVGGNDLYRHRAGGATACNTVQVNVDTSGDDVYDRSRGTHGAVHGAGSTGVGVLYDARGSDRYLVAPYYTAAINTFAQGGGEIGAGLLLDERGNDEYDLWFNGTADRSLSAHAQGVASSGAMGMLLDRGGSDAYRHHVGSSSGGIPADGGGSQAFATASAAAFLLDSGSENDQYRAGQDMSQAASSLGAFAFLADGGGANTFRVISTLGCPEYTGIDCRRQPPSQYVPMGGWGQAYSDTRAGAFLVVADGSDVYEYTAVDPSAPAEHEGRELQSAAATSGLTAHLDLGGADTYKSRLNSQSFARGGVAMFADFRGPDRYLCASTTCYAYATMTGVAVWCDAFTERDHYADGNPRIIPWAGGDIGIGAGELCSSS